MKTKVFIGVLVFLSLSIAISANTILGKIRGYQTPIFQFKSPSSNQVIATLLWNKKETDVDLIYFILDENDEPFIIGIGLASTKHFEQVTIGVQKNKTIYIMLIITKGYRANYMLNVNITESGNISKTRLAPTLDNYNNKLFYARQKIKNKISILKYYPQ